MGQREESRQKRPTAGSAAFRITLIYVLFAGVWILLSDLSLALLFRESKASDILHFEVLKGWLFVAVTASLLYVLIRRSAAALRHTSLLVRETEERFRAVFEQAGLAVLLVDRDHNIVASNRAAQGMFGYSADEFQTLAFPNYLLAGDPSQAIQNLRELVEGKTTQTSPVEIKCLRKDGGVLWGRCTLSAIYDGQGRFQLAAGIIEDITEHLSAEEQVRFQAHLLSVVGEAVIAATMEGEITFWNRYAETLYGWSAADVLNRNLFEILLPGSLVDVSEEIMAQVTTGANWIGELVVKNKAGLSFPVFMTASPILQADGRVLGMVGVSSDISKRKLLEEQLRQSQKMDALGRLAGGIAHDFNNLLTAINGYSQIAMLKLHEKDPLRKDLQEVLKAGERAASLTRQLLAFSRLQVFLPRVIDLNVVVTDIDKLLRRLIGEDIHLVASLSPGLGYVMADPGQIEQVVLNLVVNARDAMPRGGTLTIETANVDLTQDYSHQNYRAKPGAYVMLAVTDTGSGMDELTISRAFEPFFTTKEPGKGTGLGLSTVYGIVEQSGGDIRVYSEVGRGTTFKIYLPRVEKDEEPQPLIGYTDAPSRGTETILLVEDEDSVRNLVQAILKNNGYTVIQAKHGGEALLICERFEGEIHLMMTDVVMPQLSGRELAERLAPLRPQMKVLYMSGYTDDAIVRHGITQAGPSLIQKPFTPDAILRKVREMLERRE